MRRVWYLLLGMAVFLAISAPVIAQVRPRPALDPTVKEAILTALDDERAAEAFYLAVMEEHGDVAPFDRIAEAEAQHQAALLNLCAAYGIAVPVNPYDPNEITVSGILAECCQEAVAAEEANVAMFNGYLTDLVLPWNVRQVFTNLRDAALNNHLPAFQRCADGDCPDCPNDGSGPRPGRGPRKGPSTGPGPSGRR